MKVSYKWLQGYLTEKLPEPKNLVEVISMRAFEVEGLEQVGDDWMIDVDVLPNRAHDCLSHFGIAKELSVILDIPFKDFMPPMEASVEKTDLTVSVEDEQKCRRYVGRIIRNVKVGPSPDWVVEHLKTIGQKSINTVVDATNLIMFDYGQPLHAFDKQKVSGSITVANASDGEEIAALSGDEVVLKDWMLTIRDEVGPLAIAGVKGGKRAEVDEVTTDIILESANFDPVSVRKTARRLGILTDSSKRFENEPTPELAAQAMDRVTQTILEIAKTNNTVVEEVVDIYPHAPKDHSVEFALQDVSGILGVSISKNDIENILKRFGFEYTFNDDVWKIEVPAERLDMRIKEDVIEEIGRVYGYENIPSIVPKVSEVPVMNKEFYYTTKLRQFFLSRGFSEVYTYSFDSLGDVKVKNPLASDKGRLRNSLVPGMKAAFELNAKNAPLLGGEVKIFEIGTVFAKNMHEETVVGFTDVDGVVEELKSLLGRELNVVAEDNIMQFSLTTLLDRLPEPEGELVFDQDSEVALYAPFSLYPYTTRDIAVWMPKADDPERLVNMIKVHGGGLVASEPKRVDEYEKDGRVSYAYRVVFQAQDRTLTDKEVGEIMDAVYKEAEDQEGWEIR